MMIEVWTIRERNPSRNHRIKFTV